MILFQQLLNSIFEMQLFIPRYSQNVARCKETHSPLVATFSHGSLENLFVQKPLVTCSKSTLFFKSALHNITCYFFAKFACYSLQNSLVAKEHSLLVVKFASSYISTLPIFFWQTHIFWLNLPLSPFFTRNLAFFSVFFGERQLYMCFKR